MYSKMKINFFTIVLLLSVLVNSCVTQEQSGTKTGALKYNPSDLFSILSLKSFMNQTNTQNCI
jgi:hypothetical protein